MTIKGCIGKISEEMLKVKTNQKSEDQLKICQWFTQWTFFTPWADTILR